jgi:outer membrane protein assembly factor BamB
MIDFYVFEDGLSGQKYTVGLKGILLLCVMSIAMACTSDLPTGRMMTPDELGIQQPGCRPNQASPYATGIPYLGVHGNAANSDFIDCETPEVWTRSWHGLRGFGMTQPNTFSPQGDVTYLTSTSPLPDGCRLYAISVETGEELWCKSYPTDIERGSVEVDAEGRLYFTVDEALISLTPDGDELWRVPLLDNNGDPSGGWGVHFTPHGYVATVTASGRVYLIQREEGRVLASFDVAQELGFVGPETFGVELDPSELLPDAVKADIANIWGNPSNEEQASGFSALLGSGEFVDNTLAVSERGDIYIMSGGPTPQQGALVQLRVSGAQDVPQLTLGWQAITNKGSATTPSISKGDGYVVIGDGAHPSAYLNPSTVDAQLKIYDIASCDANSDGDSDPFVCGVDWSYDLERGAMLGAPAIMEDGTVILWEMGLAFDADPTDADVVAVRKDGVVWSTALPDDMDWSSVITVTRNHVIGSASRVEVSQQGLPGLKLPLRTTDRLVVLDRTTGELTWYADLPDDCAATVTVGPDGSLFVPMMGLFSILAIEDRPTLGVLRFKPDYSNTVSSPPPLRMSSPATQSGPTEVETERAPSDASHSQPEMESEVACFDVNLDELEPCCDTGPAHCVDVVLPERFASQVATCAAGGVCVPDPVLVAVGSYEPQTCASIGGVQGACMSTCLSEVAANAALLPQDVCSTGEVCVPCISPLDGLETGVCGTISCGGEQDVNEDTRNDETESTQEASDDGAATSVEVPPACCGGAGTCLGDAFVPDRQESSLRSCRQEGHRDLLCVPNEFLEASWTPQTCVGEALIGDDYDGVCLPKCLKLPFEFTLDDSSCSTGFICAPCINSITGDPTGAPGCQ